MFINFSVDGQTVLNGSFNGAATGNSQFQNMPDWFECTDNLGWDNSVDVCDINFPAYNSQTTVTPISSPDGGQWAGLANGQNPLEDECIIGNITGLTVGENYLLEFYGACFGTGNGNYANGSPVSMTINIGNDEHIVVVPMAASIWNTYCLNYTAVSTDMTFRIHNNAGDGYVGLDGFSTSLATLQSTVSDTTACEGEQVLLDATTANSSYSWQDNSTAATYIATAAGTYWVEVATACALRVDTFHVSFNAAPVIELGDSVALCDGQEILLDASTPNATYLWQDNSTAPTFLVSVSGNYSVVVSAGGCTATDEVIVIVDDCGHIIEMPNVFSPNNDGSNEYFGPVVMDGIENARLHIYNRWGQMIFETTDLERGWNGKSSNGEAPEGTYLWTLSYNGVSSGRQELKGHLTLLR